MAFLRKVAHRLPFNPLLIRLWLRYVDPSRRPAVGPVPWDILMTRWNGFHEHRRAGA